MSVACPQCGYEQDGGIQCRKCFAFLLKDAPAKTSSGRAFAMPGRLRGAGSPGVFRIAYRVFRWGTLAALVVVLFLIFHKSPPPPVPTDPQAPARLESKLRDSQSAASAGQPHQLRLDSPEVNALLDSSLAVKRDPAPAGSPPASPGKEADPSLEEVQSSVRDVKINLLEDRVQAYVVFDFHGRDMSLLLEGRLHVEGGYLRFEPTEGKLGSLPLPLSTLESAVSKMMSSPENREKLRVPPEISDIRIEHGDLVVAYK